MALGTLLKCLQAGLEGRDGEEGEEEVSVDRDRDLTGGISMSYLELFHAIGTTFVILEGNF